MANAAFDTFKYVQTLTDSKAFTAEQAKILMQAQREAFEGGVATKDDISNLRAELKEETSKVKMEFLKLENKMTDNKSELIKWFIGVAIAQAALIFSMLKFFSHN